MPIRPSFSCSSRGLRSLELVRKRNFLSWACSHAMKSSAPGMTRCMWYSTPSMSMTKPFIARMSDVSRGPRESLGDSLEEGEEGEATEEKRRREEREGQMDDEDTQ